MNHGPGNADSVLSFNLPTSISGFLRVAEIGSCGIMVGTAVLFPIANDGNFSYLGL